MKLRIILGLAALMVTSFGLTSVGYSQEYTQAGKDVDATLLKINKLNILKYVTPLLLKKTQLNALMTTIEKCQAKEKEIIALDAKEFKKIDAEIDKALDGALNDGSYPKRELQSRIIVLQDALIIRRKLATNEMVDMLLETCKKNLNEGQMAAMVNLTDPNYVEGETKVSKLPNDEKTKLYIREILLSPLTYDIFKQLAKKAQ
jgi:hypothetical protein